MQKHFWAIAVSVIGGLVLWVMQGELSRWWHSNDYTVSFSETVNPIILTPSFIEFLGKKQKITPGNYEFHTITLSNNGNDISGHRFSLPILDLVAAGSIVAPLNNEENVRFVASPQRLNIDYKFLPKGSSHQFYIVTSGEYEWENIAFSPAAPGVNVKNENIGEVANDDNAYLWVIGIFAVIIFGIAFLISVGERSAQRELKDKLKAAGHNYDDLVGMGQNNVVDR